MHCRQPPALRLIASQVAGAPSTCSLNAAGQRASIRAACCTVSSFSRRILGLSAPTNRTRASGSISVSF